MGYCHDITPCHFFEKEVKSIFDALTNSDINLQVFVMLKFITIAFIASFLILLYLDKVITKKDKLFLALEFLITIILASLLQPVYWFTFYFLFFTWS
jgi:beta-carotene 15,15'-dioxygenase